MHQFNNLHRRWLLACVSAAVAVVLACSPLNSPAQPASDRDAIQAGPPRKLVLMHYMPWYETPQGRGQWGGHWTGFQQQHDPSKTNSNGLPDIWSHYHPLIGLYDSADPDVLECQLLQMKLAGIDGVIVDWYGIHDVADYAPIHEATQAMFDSVGKLGMKFAACYEDRTVQNAVDAGMIKAERITEHLTETFRWMQANWFEKPAYVRVGGRPLLLNFGPIYVKDAEVWRAALDALPMRPAYFALHHLWKDIGADGGFTWVHPKAWEDDPDPATAVAHLRREHAWTTKDPAKMIPSAITGFHDVYENSHQVIDHRDGQTLRESLAAVMGGPWPIVQLVTWNDYGEGTMIEPTHELGYTFLEIIQDARREELGASFNFTADDLRLPAELLKQRQAGNVPKEKLDRVAAMLNAGQCDAARETLKALAP